MSRRINRRSVVKVTGASAIAGLGVLPSVTQAKGEKERYVGYAYDPVEMEILGDARATVVNNSSGVKGSLHVDEHQVKLNETGAKIGSDPMPHRRYSAKNRSGYEVYINAVNTQMTGYILPSPGRRFPNESNSGHDPV